MRSGETHPAQPEAGSEASLGAPAGPRGLLRATDLAAGPNLVFPLALDLTEGLIRQFEEIAGRRL